MKNSLEDIAVDFEFEGEVRCLCGGIFGLGRLKGLPFVKHTLPFCDEYEKVDSDEAAIALSERCRAAIGDFRPA